MIRHDEISGPELRKQIRERSVVLGGNEKLKIYGKLNCRSGRRMNKGNRVFFGSLQEALNLGFRPCGHCLPADYKKMEK